MNIIIFNDYNWYKLMASNKITGIIHQIGGSKKIKYKYKNNTYIWNENKSSDTIQYIIYTESSDHNNAMICVMCTIVIREKNNFIYINNMSAYPNCSMEGLPKLKIGSELLDMTIEFIKTVLKQKYNLKYIQLKDNSHYYCQITKQTLDFDSIYMLSRGDTWYGKRGFKPFDPENEIIDIENYVRYRINSKLINVIKIKCTNIKEYFEKAVSKLKIDNRWNNDNIKKIFDKYADKTIREFMYDLTIKYNKTCDIVGLIYKDIMKDIGMDNLHGITYFFELD